MTDQQKSRYALVPGARLATLIRDRSFQIIGNQNGLLALASELASWWQHGRNLFFKEDDCDDICFDEMWEVDSCKRNTFIEVNTTAFGEPLRWHCVLDKERSYDQFMLGFAKGDPSNLFDLVLDEDVFSFLHLAMNKEGYDWLYQNLLTIASREIERVDIISGRWSVSVAYSEDFPHTEAELRKHTFVDYPIDLAAKEIEALWIPPPVNVYSSEDLDELVCTGSWYKSIARFLLSVSMQRREGAIIVDFDEGDIKWSRSMPTLVGASKGEELGLLQRLIFTSGWTEWVSPEEIKDPIVYKFTKTDWAISHPAPLESAVSYERRGSEGIITMNKDAYSTLCEWFAFTAFISDQIEPDQKRFAHYHLSYLLGDSIKGNGLSYELTFNLS